MFESISFYGPLVGLASFLIIGISHPLVIKMEYHFGKKSWWALFVPGVIFSLLSLFFSSQIVSILFGVLGFSFFWSTHEIFKQHERVAKGRAKRNPKRNYDA